ncbi:MAG: hypothetical protein ACRDRK_27515 [Pseudonocardia sp.]
MGSREVSVPVTVLHALIRAANLSWDEAAQRVSDAFNDAENDTLSLTGRHLRRIAMCEREGHRPTPTTRRALEYAFSQTVDQLLAPHVPASIRTDSTIASRIANASVEKPLTPEIEACLAEPPGNDAGASQRNLEWQVVVAARRALNFSVQAQGSNVGPDMLEELFMEVRRIGTEYQLSPIHMILGDLLNLQDIVFRLLDGRQRPADTRDLFLVAGLTSGMLANASHDLGDNRAALTQARTAYICADNADHDTLRAWVRGIQSMVSYWAGWAHDAVRFATLGTEPASRVQGTVTCWIPSLQGRAWALLGNVAEAKDAVARASQAREVVVLSDLDKMGGKLTFPLPRQLYYNADTNSWLAGEESATLDFGERALAGYANLPPSQRSYIDESIARIDIALAQARQGNLSGVEATVSPVLELAPTERIGGVVVNIARLRAELRGKPEKSAESLTRELEDFTQITASAVLAR